PRTRAIIAIDPFGLVAENAPLEAVARDAGAALIADAACSLGGRNGAGVPGGGYGDVATFSFHPRKIITSGEGGALLTDREDLAAILRGLRNHGQERRGVFSRTATNARLADTAAALGRSQLHRLETMLTERR